MYCLWVRIFNVSTWIKLTLLLIWSQSHFFLFNSSQVTYVNSYSWCFHVYKRQVSDFASCLVPKLRVKLRRCWLAHVGAILNCCVFYSGVCLSLTCSADQISPVFLCMNAFNFIICVLVGRPSLSSALYWYIDLLIHLYSPVWDTCYSLTSSSSACSLDVSSVCRFVHVYLSNLFFSSRLFLSFSFFASCCRCHSQHCYCYSFCCGACRGPWGPSSGSPWLSQPWPCT